MIVRDRDREYELEDRPAEMIRFILSRMDVIRDTTNVKIEHNCAGTRMQSKLTTFDSEARIMR